MLFEGNKEGFFEAPMRAAPGEATGGTIRRIGAARRIILGSLQLSQQLQPSSLTHNLTASFAASFSSASASATFSSTPSPRSHGLTSASPSRSGSSTTSDRNHPGDPTLWPSSSRSEFPAGNSSRKFLQECVPFVFVRDHGRL